MDNFWSQEPGTVRLNLTMFIKLGVTAREELVL